MIEQKSFLNRQPVIMQLMILVFLVFACTFIFTIASMMLVGPLYGIDGADSLILKATENPDALKENRNETWNIQREQSYDTKE